VQAAFFMNEHLWVYYISAHSVSVFAERRSKMQSKYTTEEQIEEMRKEIQQEKEKMSQKGRRNILTNKKFLFILGRQLLFVSIVLFLAANLIFIQIAKSRGEIPGILGFHLFVVESGSMEPTFHVGSVLLCRKPQDPAKLQVKDVVTFRNVSGHVVTHRIVEVIAGETGAAAYRTKGDNPQNSADSENLTPDRVLAVFVLKIPLT
jgi:signal peptidase